MICIRCKHDSKYPERRNRKCPKCGGVFAFEPREGDALTDKAFAKAIEAVSSGGRLRWNRDHLYYELCRRRRKAIRPGIALGILVVCFIVGLVVGKLLLFFMIGGVIAILAFVIGWRFAGPTVRLSRRTFEQLWTKWVAAHGTPKGLIAPPRQPTQRPPVEADIGDYSFDRAVICDKPSTVDLLLANNFHFENNCAVLSVDGYPPGPFETVRRMLRRNPRLQVFALHDASPAGCRLAQQLATDPQWFAGHVPVNDVGLRPRHSQPFAGLLLPARDGNIAPGDGISHEEATWLARYVLELAAIRPEQTLKRLFRAINRKADPTQAGGNGGGGGGGGDSDRDSKYEVEYDNESFSAESTDSDGGADSFG